MKRYLKSFTSLEKIIDTIKDKKRNYLKKGGGVVANRKSSLELKRLNLFRSFKLIMMHVYIQTDWQFWPPVAG